ncbi:MAG: hypothetical protein JOZ15_18345 [Acidobacteria bacterium]|nr:hypothetical protein [Acidobacteriota bacterium]
MSEPSVPPPPPSYTPPPPPPGGPTSGTVSPNRTIMIVLSYLGILAVIPFVAETEDKEVQWHAKHGLVLLACDIIVIIGLEFIAMLLHGLSCFLFFLWPLVGLVILVVHVLCIIKGTQGQRFIIPGISQYADRF